MRNADCEIANWGRGKGFVAFIWLLFLLLPSSITFAADPSIQAYIDRDTVPLDQTLNLTVEIQGGGAFSSPDIPPLGHFDVEGRSSGSTVQIMNGEMSVKKTFSYELSPRNVGEYSIGPIVVHIEGKEYSAGPIQVKVVEADKDSTYAPLPGLPSPPSGPQRGFPSFPFTVPNPFQDQPSSANGRKQADIFLTADVDKKEVYVGEQTLFTFRLYSSVNIRDAQLTLPVFKDFISEELFKDRKYEVELQGRRYAVNEWKFALFPTKAGKIGTGAASVTGSVPVATKFSPFEDAPFFTPFRFSSKPKTFRAPNVEIQVKPLPTPPPGFTGLVGKYNLASSFSPDQLKVGDTAYLKIELSGNGNIQAANLPDLKRQDFFKIYPSKPEVDLKKSSEGLSGKKTFNYALVAEQPGGATIPPLEINYFNPESGEYENLSTPLFSANISGQKEEEKIVTSGIQTTAISSQKDILPAIQKIYRKLISIFKNKWVWLAIAALLLAYLGKSVLNRWKGRSALREQERKKSRAFRKAKKRLRLTEKTSEKEPFFKVSQIFKDYLTDRYFIKGCVLTPLEVEAFLSQKGLPQEWIRRSTYFLEQLDQYKYGGSNAGLPSLEEMNQEAIVLMQEIEKYS
jgi:hypothetical protein